MFIPAALLDALIQSCRPALPAGTTLLKSGDSADSPLSLQWLELWVDRLGSPVARRNTAANQIDLSLTVNCFGRSSSTPSQVQSLAETTRQHLTALRLPLTINGVPAGLISLREAEMRDLSRPATQKSAGLLQWSVTVRGTLQLTTSTPS